MTFALWASAVALSYDRWIVFSSTRGGVLGTGSPRREPPTPPQLDQKIIESRTPIAPTTSKMIPIV